jgi:hypothetical protein
MVLVIIEILKTVGAKQQLMLMDDKRASPNTTSGGPAQRKAVINLLIDQPVAGRNSNHYGNVRRKMRICEYPIMMRKMRQVRYPPRSNPEGRIRRTLLWERNQSVIRICKCPILKRKMR